MAVVLGIPLRLGETGYLVTRRIVKETIVKAAYGIAIVLVLVPLIVSDPQAVMRRLASEWSCFW